MRREVPRSAVGDVKRQENSREDMCSKAAVAQVNSQQPGQRTVPLDLRPKSQRRRTDRRDEKKSGAEVHEAWAKVTVFHLGCIGASRHRSVKGSRVAIITTKLLLSLRFLGPATQNKIQKPTISSYEQRMCDAQLFLRKNVQCKQSIMKRTNAK